MRRLIEPELLDKLPSNDVRAIRSREDLRRLNSIMGNAQALTKAFLLGDGFDPKKPLQIWELGGGDGTLLLELARKWSELGVTAEAVVVDRNPTLSEDVKRAFSDLNWQVRTVSADIFNWLQGSGALVDLILTNLLLHHFSDPVLRGLLRLIAYRTKRFIACEPRRSGLALRASQLVGLIGCNSVTRHDAVVSVRAGFRGRELSELWPSETGAWVLDERPAGLFSHCFVAKRNG